ncbi:hypothetical protein [Nocardioides sp. L-11A]|uniref:hypothetical protein n=1 Tax=Nocardioides sp. L-11A TaxID=3043848 RepID=UPI00249A7C70|nr:hypothetical protein QJ852_09845 [Nocardioides sp. L-11A]
MADYDQIIFLRDASLEDKVAALVEGIATHPTRIAVEPYHDPADPEVELAIFFAANNQTQLDEWVDEVRQRLAEQLDLDAAAAPTADEYELVELARQR